MSVSKLGSEQRLILENIKKMFRRNSEQQFAGFFNIQGVSSEEAVLPPTRVLGHIFGAVIVQGTDFRLTIKIHSDLKPIRPLCARNMQIPEDEVGERMMRDFLREVANLLGGAMRTELARNSVDSGLSLPFSSRGFDEVFFDATESDKSVMQAFRLNWSKGGLYCTQYVEILSGWDSLLPMKGYDPDAPAPTVDDFESILGQRN